MRAEAEEGEPSDAKPDESGRLPRPTGPDDYVWYKGSWCKPRAGDGSLQLVDGSGTFVRKRAQPSELAHPPNVGDPSWRTCNQADKLKLIAEYQAGIAKKSASSSSAAAALHAFTVALPARKSSMFPPWEGPPPTVVARRIVVDDPPPAPAPAARPGSRS